MDRQQRHDLKHDKFVDEIGVLSSKARANQRLLLAIAGSIVALALIAYGVYFFRSNREQNAQQALATAIETFDAPIGDAPAGQPVPPGPRFKTEPERTAAAEKQFKDVQAKFSGSDASDIAGLYLARIAMTRGDAATARKALEEFVGDHDDHILVGTARYSLYQLRLENGEAAQVATELQGQLDNADAALPTDAMLALLAQAYEVQGNREQSQEAYRRLASEFPDSPYALDAQRRIGTA
ncbi:MAG TPA: tetratricopeptide repeat protein [Thermoanaerobaculia bacterium]|nr:tetratricopeptide repeat protein [Thermoanaerobaculia bacterium]